MEFEIHDETLDTLMNMIAMKIKPKIPKEHLELVYRDSILSDRTK